PFARVLIYLGLFTAAAVVIVGAALVLGGRPLS
ncbi:MAG: hypothetical protein JWO33_85, partial [Caulobacteraceae bacterium]|nr:hypothetical protein [Caulobacteraceae bacterium]